MVRYVPGPCPHPPPPPLVANWKEYSVLCQSLRECVLIDSLGRCSFHYLGEVLREHAPSEEVQLPHSQQYPDIKRRQRVGKIKHIYMYMQIHTLAEVKYLCTCTVPMPHVHVLYYLIV